MEESIFCEGIHFCEGIQRESTKTAQIIPLWLLASNAFPDIGSVGRIEDIK